MEISEIKNFLRIDDDIDDKEIESLQKAAEIYLTNAGVKKSYDNELYCSAIKLLVSYWYDNRSPVAIGKTSKSLEFSLHSIIIQLANVGDSNV
ncbi:phage gp6-like head-tail connector protein [Clostridium botulinum C]|uniref:head-tail connector protein n=1 Tax=Clostridium botulinum TaxID=1491 RepID=UPI001E3B9204|nr:head-tail connector protein [Clostridium botulinum]MCD3206777.1 phage gp6-like head-tail connector protein [Clostridium botulinum C]MCD3209568.1 phage gp6-like head-tail connector protein [Clostridium botulinum C]MCD3226577.1 phage gp6-like head-tail connector protein [Clostridium botulinum C]MCD3249010.1 phage gp6-like head-tail connector protein [Clostridium botulinum C]MCD3257459.1 phage gp6-like head-tail connector protein [Clostridium botulinum C]